MNKREFLKTMSLLSIGLAVNPRLSAQESTSFPARLSLDPGTGGFTLPQLGFEYTRLEPYIDAETMDIHHNKHHAAYVKNLNDALEKNPSFMGLIIEDLMAKIGEGDTALRNNGGGHYNHTLFWKLLLPSKSKNAVGDLARAIDEQYISFDKFKEQFTAEAKNRFGSGWAWLCMDKNKKLFICSTPNQDNPLMTNIVKQGGYPIIGLDVWEHAYYLHYQNRRADYINAFWEVLNWEVANERYGQFLMMK